MMIVFSNTVIFNIDIAQPYNHLTMYVHIHTLQSIQLSISSLKPLMKIVQSQEDTVAYWAVRTIAGLTMIRSMFY